MAAAPRRSTTTARAPRAPRASRTPLERLRALCLALPEAQEVEAWGEPTFRVRNRIFAMYAAANNHHGAGRRAGVWCKSTPMTQDLLLHAAPDRFFKPPYVGPKGWTGVFLDGAVEWDELGGLLADAWRLTAPKRLAATLDTA